MDYVNLGATGLRVSRICLGMMSFGSNSERPWVLDEDAAEPIAATAAEGGVTFFDTADVYFSGASEAVHRVSADGTGCADSIPRRRYFPTLRASLRP